VAAFGGDGTVGDVARGIVGSDSALGILPMGTGNDVARNLGLPLDLGVACDTLARGKTRRVGTSIGRRPHWKKAIVTLREGSIDTFGFEG